MSARDYGREVIDRTAFIRGVLADSGADGIIYGNSGGKDCTLAGYLCKQACDNTVGLILPCGSKRNYGEDMDDALAAAELFGVKTRVIDLTAARDALLDEIKTQAGVTGLAAANAAARLRMIALYTVGSSENRLVAGTGNRSERYMGYFTKWGDGACDFNPIADLTVTEIYEFLRYIGAPENIANKVPSAGLYEGQTDENEMGVAYASIDGYLLNGVADARDLAIMERYHKTSGHKRALPAVYGVYE